MKWNPSFFPFCILAVFFTLLEGTQSSLSQTFNPLQLTGLLTCLGQSPLLTKPVKYKPTDKLLTEIGYTVENHTVTTTDGYILKVFRVTGSPANPPPPPPGTVKPAVFINHGLAGTSNQWLVQQGNNSIVQLLADNGFDVWVGNCRGNSFSNRTSVSMTPEQYWDFSWHEMGIYDVPAVLDMIINISNQAKIYYIGYSMGGSQYLIGNSMIPSLNDKIRTGFLLAPAGFVGHATTPLIYATKLLELSYNKGYLTDTLIGQKINTNDALNQYLYGSNGGYACDTILTNCAVCNNLMFAIFGFNGVEMNYTALPSFYANYADVIGTKCVVHYAQSINSKQFRQFDYGVDENILKYGTAEPPNYNLAAITAPTVIFYGRGDNLVSPQDTVITANAMNPNVLKELNLVDPTNTNSGFNHLDFVVGIHDYPFIFQKILYTMNNQLYG